MGAHAMLQSPANTKQQLHSPGPASRIESAGGAQRLAAVARLPNIQGSPIPFATSQIHYAKDTFEELRNVLCDDAYLLCQWRSGQSRCNEIETDDEDPHVGHLHSMIMADIHTRYKALWTKTTLLATGTDEHGMKVILR